MTDFDLDDLLNLEEDFYKEGFEEGQNFSTREQLMEGKEYGYQTGFQRFLIIGYIKGSLKVWAEKNKNNSSILSHISVLEKLVDNISSANDDVSVAEYEKKLKIIRNKVRMITINSEYENIAKIDELIDQIGGKLQVSENTDEMW